MTVMSKFSLAGFPFGGLVLAAAWWFVLFSPWTRPAQGSFWWGLFLATGTLLGYSVWLLRTERASLFCFSPRWVFVGLGSAFFLYGIVWIGYHGLSAFAPGIVEAVGTIYARRTQAPAWVLIPLLGLWIGPAEEIFWRGVVQRYFQKRFTPIAGLIVATLLYSLVHAWSGNIPLLLVAFVAGLVWGLLFLWSGSLLPGILSHALWDVAVFVLLPLQ